MAVVTLAFVGLWFVNGGAVNKRSRSTAKAKCLSNASGILLPSRGKWLTARLRLDEFREGFSYGSPLMIETSGLTMLMNSRCGLGRDHEP
jgi:hypothetical protein